MDTIFKSKGLFTFVRGFPETLSAVQSQTPCQPLSNTLTSRIVREISIYCGWTLDFGDFKNPRCARRRRGSRARGALSSSSPRRRSCCVWLSTTRGVYRRLRSRASSPLTRGTARRSRRSAQPCTCESAFQRKKEKTSHQLKSRKT